VARVQLMTCWLDQAVRWCHHPERQPRACVDLIVCTEKCLLCARCARRRAWRAVQVWKAWDDSHGFYNKHKGDDETRSKSLLFNAFIFMQVFNEINSRKILDEYNVLAGLASSPIFVAVIVITVGLQILIVQSPVRIIFHVSPLNGALSRSLALYWRSSPASLCGVLQLAHCCAVMSIAAVW
jgi:Cation transporting ATPase, C-terminus